MYLKRSMNALINDMQTAKTHGYSFGVKLVRGAYMKSEYERAQTLNYPCPLLEDKHETDCNYNRAIELLLSKISQSSSSGNSSRPSLGVHNENTNEVVVGSYSSTIFDGDEVASKDRSHDSTEAIPKISLIIATHNRQSIELSQNIMTNNHLFRSHKQVMFAQILGLCDHLTFNLSLNGYNAYKLVPYGSFQELYPWLLRRLDENQVAPYHHLMSSFIILLRIRIPLCC
jgi:proline dehydrogenase